MVSTWDYFHKFDTLTNIPCKSCEKTYNKDYKPFFNVGGNLVCYDCVTESNSISYNTQVNLPDVKPNNWKMGESVQYKNE
tara:strand:- start:328 stop:567 length:240 start_codon:yes stop_codon:yes gene_type:complete